MRLPNKNNRRFLAPVFLISGGWFGEFSLIVSWFRVIDDWWRSGQIGSIPYITNLPGSPQFSWLYGLSWRVHFFVGSSIPENLLGIALLGAIVVVFYEAYIKNS